MLALARSALRRASFASSASRCSTVFARNATTDEQRDPAKELEELERLVGEVNAAKLRNLGGIPLRLGTGVVVKGITRLRDEHQIDIEGKGLMRFMNASVAARIDDDVFFTGLVRLRDHKIEGGDLVKFMCGSVGPRLGTDAFHESLAILGRCMQGTEIARLMCNHIASRLTPDYATHLVDIVTHINSHGFGGPGKLHILLYCSPTTQYVPQLRKDILGIDQPEELTAFLKKFPQSSGKTYAQIKHTLSELYDPTQTEPSAAK